MMKDSRGDDIELMTLGDLLFDLLEAYGNYKDLPMYVTVDGVRYPVTGTTFTFTIAEGSYGEIQVTPPQHGEIQVTQK